MATYKTYCWQIFRLDQTRLGPVREHRVKVVMEDKLNDIKNELEKEASHIL